MLGTTEIMMISGVVMLLFGAQKLPEFARGLGSAKKEFENAMKDDVLEKDTEKGE